ncbi:E3 ubiquitin-protein ligase TRIM39-like [Lissotriton helveticus]
MAAAAAASQFGNLKEETSCSICLEYFSDPVTIDCGHNFCRSCITCSWEGRDDNFPCPQCRETSLVRNLRPNRQLGNIVEIAKQLHRPPAKPSEDTLCEKHGERLRLFCEEDQRMICWVCRESKDHKTHSASPIDEAAEQFKAKLQDWLCPLQKEMEYAVESKCREEEQYKTLMIKLKEEKEKIKYDIEQLRQILSENEKTMNNRLEEIEKKITRVENANIAKLSNQITSLNVLITEIQKRFEEPAWGLLKDVRSILSRCNDVTFQTVKSYKVTVTLDPDTANPRLVLSENQRHVRVADKAQILPQTPKRFTNWWSVLGSKGFTSGRHYWEVQLVQEGVRWYVGVLADSVNRKSNFSWSPQTGVWAVTGSNGQYSVLTSPQISLSPRDTFKKLGMYLDYEGGRLAVYNADSMELLYTFPHTSFTQRLFPIFNLWQGAELRMV